MPNGVELSPDGKTLYVNNTWAQPGENFVWAYDVAADGSLSNKRQFAMLNLTPEVLGAAKPVDRFDSGADGTAVDTDGRYYVATSSGVQIFLPDGTLRRHDLGAAVSGQRHVRRARTTTCSTWSAQTRRGRFRRRSAAFAIRRESSDRRAQARTLADGGRGRRRGAWSRPLRAGRGREGEPHPALCRNGRRAVARTRDARHVPPRLRAGSGEAPGLRPREDAQAADASCRGRRRPITTTASSWSSRTRSCVRSGSPRPPTSACGRRWSGP